LDAGRQPRHGVAEPLQHRAEKQVVLEAVAAAPPPHELVLDPVESELGGPAEHDVEVLEGDRGGVRAMQAAQRVGARRQGARVGDPLQVGAEVKEVGLPLLCGRRTGARRHGRQANDFKRS